MQGELIGTLTGSGTSQVNPSTITGTVNNVAVGDLVYAVWGQQTGLTVGVGSTNPSDNLGNTYTWCNAGTDPPTSGTPTARAAWSIVTAGGTLTQVSAPATASANNYANFAAVIQGPFEPAAQQPATNPANGTGDITSPFTCPASGTLPQAHCEVMAFYCCTSSATFSATSPNLLAGQATSAALVKTVIGYQEVTSTGSVSPAFTGTNPSGDSVLGTTAFRLAAIPIAASMAGVGTLAVNAAPPSVTWQGSALLAGVGSLGVNARIAFWLVSDTAAYNWSIADAITTLRYVIGASLHAGAGGMSANATVVAGAGIHQGAASLAGAGLVASAALLREIVSSSLAGAGSLAAAALLKEQAAAELSGAGSVIADVVFGSIQASARLDGDGDLVVGEVSASLSAAAPLSGSGGLSVPAALSEVASAQMVGSGVLFANAAVAGSRLLVVDTAVYDWGIADAVITTRYMLASSLLAGAGALAADATVVVAGVHQGAARFSGAGALAANVSPVPRLIAATAAYDWDIADQVTLEVRWSASASLSGAGGLAVNATVTTAGVHQGSALVAGTSTLVASGILRERVAALLSGAGSIAAAAALRERAAALMQGAGSASVDVFVAGSLPISARLDGAGAFSGSALKRAAGDTLLQGAGALAAAARLREQASVSLQGAGSLVVTGVGDALGNALFAGSGALSALAVKRTTGAVDLHGLGTLASASVMRGQVVTRFDGAGALSATAILRERIASQLSGAGLFINEVLVAGSHPGAAMLTGNGTLSASLIQRATAAARLQGAGSLVDGVTLRGRVSARFDGTSALASFVVKYPEGAARLQGAGNLAQVAAIYRPFVVVQPAGVGALSASALVIHRPRMLLQGAGGIEEDVDEIALLSMAMAGAGQVSVKIKHARQIQALSRMAHRVEGSMNSDRKLTGVSTHVNIEAEPLTGVEIQGHVA